MELHWVHEKSPVWDADKRRVIGGAPEGAFELPFDDGDELPGDWWTVHSGAADGPVVGYGRLDITFGGDAELLLATDPAEQQQGVGTFILEQLEGEADQRGINYVYNTIRPHPQRDRVHAWLLDRGYEGPADGDLRKRVGSPTRDRA